jgi:phosphoribosylformylglycinamidine cyclo-ligase
MSAPIDHVDYSSLDKAKNAFIDAGRKTLRFAEQFGFIPNETLGASANVFSLNLKPFLQSGQDNLYITLLPEGLGTADDARPDDLTQDELIRFWKNIATKTMGTLTNDAASAGMQTILVSLYLPSCKPELVFNKPFLDGFLDGFVDCCKQIGCVYFSGETPQLKNKIVEDKLDIAGALFGLMPARLSPITGTDVAAGDYIIFVESAGPDANGFTSLRELATKLPQGYRTLLPSSREYWRAINEPTKLYTPFIQEVLKLGIKPSNIEPISGHGWQKLMRSNKPLSYIIHETLPIPEIFTFIQEQTNTSQKEMVKIFNYGVGMAVYVTGKENADAIVATAKKHSLNAIVAGEIIPSEKREVVIEPYGITLESDAFLLAK